MPARGRQRAQRSQKRIAANCGGNVTTTDSSVGYRTRWRQAISKQSRMRFVPQSIALTTVSTIADHPAWHSSVPESDQGMLVDTGLLNK